MNKTFTFYEKHKNFWTKENAASFGMSVFFFLVAMSVQHIADAYVNRLRGTAVDDLLLSNLPVLDIDALIILGALVLTLILLFLGFLKPKYVNFGLKSMALFIVVRSFLISLTHLGADPGQLVLDPNSFGFGLYNILFNAKNDFFFSGHTGVPFLAALIFWPETKWRYFFLAVSFAFGAAVLFAHMHYSIDVFAAPFITYSIFALTKHLFPQDYEISRRE
ncbi:phosphatase PAP2 family protein [Patescibacteria group bacterium]|nr:phosphatase PAP2 family protein [Patescibacteria group bacterium]